VRSAAWRISLWGTVAFALGTLVLFMSLHQFVGRDIQRRSDIWLSGEVKVLSDVAERTPANDSSRVLGEVAELAEHEIPNRPPSHGGPNDSVFFVRTAADGSLVLWAGAGDPQAYLRGIQAARSSMGTRTGTNEPFDVKIPQSRVPYRVATAAMTDGGRIYLGLSQREERHVLEQMRVHFLKLWGVCVLLGFAILFFTTRRMLGDVRRISEAAAQIGVKIGDSDLSRRVPTSRSHDEIAQLAVTLNRMLERIEQSVHQLHTITNSLAHDLRSPLTAIRARLEIALTRGVQDAETDSIECAIEEIDRLTEVLNQSLDVAEAQAGALRMQPASVDLEALLGEMIELYGPGMNERGLQLEFVTSGPLHVKADAALLHRMIANLLDNEMKHLPAARTVRIALGAVDGFAQMTVEDDGPGFAPEITQDLFKAGVKGTGSRGYGLGLAFVQAVAGAHGGSATAENREDRGGARVVVKLPVAAEVKPAEPDVVGAASDARV
jgi:signal transduction histidine kinase